MSTIKNFGDVTVKLLDFSKLTPVKFTENNKMPTGPLTNISLTKDVEYPNLITTLIYVQANKLEDPKDVSGIDLLDSKIYLNYKGLNKVTVFNGEKKTVLGRSFNVEFKCEKEATEYDRYYLQFAYKVNNNSSAEVLFIDEIHYDLEVRDDLETERGTVVEPVEPPIPHVFKL